MLRFKNILLAASLLFFQVLQSAQLTLPGVSEEEDAFAWQNSRHYQETIATFSRLAEQEYLLTVNTMIDLLGKAEPFFRNRHDTLLSKLRERIFNWMKRDILDKDIFKKEYNRPAEQPETEDEYASDDDTWRIDLINGYNHVSEDDGDPSGLEDDTSRQEMSFEDDNGEYSQEYNAAYERWQLGIIEEVLDMQLNSIAEFTEKSITIRAIKKFLKDCVEDGYSWLLNEMIGAEMLTHEDLTDKLCQLSGISSDKQKASSNESSETLLEKNVLLEILEGLWFDYDWESYDVTDPLYISDTYKATLLDLKDGKRAQDIKRYVIASINKLFTYNNNHFDEAFSSLRDNYNLFVKQRNWITALVEWSVYCVYRRDFAQSEDQLTRAAKNASLMPLFKKINTDTRMNDALSAERKRAQKEYKKVYLDPSVTTLAYTNKSGQAGTLDMSKQLSILKAIGISYEPFRPGAENVFVPQLFIIVQKADEETAPEFIEIPLRASECKLNGRPLSCYGRDTIFPHGPDKNYFDQVKEDYIGGCIIQGKEELVARQEITDKIKSKTACSTELVHSERVMMKLFRTKAFVQHIVEKLASKLDGGKYFIHGAAMLAYSTNCVCSQCTPTLISLMNSHAEGQFLYMLASELKAYEFEGAPVFHLPEATDATSPTNWTQFRMNIFVTASTVFDCQSHYTTEVDQYKGTKYKKIPDQSTANRHAKLYRPHNTLDISETPQTANSSPDANQRFFYEFVGKTIHTLQVPNLYNDRLVFTSGGSKGPWDKK